MFVVVPVVEIAIFVEVGGRIGVMQTIGIVVLTAMIGTALLRHQGLQTLAKVQASLERQEFPLREVFDGLCLLFAGALLLTPGFLTDTLGLTLFIPAVRNGLRHVLLRYLIKTGRVSVDFGVQAGGRAPRDDGVIDGDWRDVTPEKRDGNGDDDDPKRIGK